MTTSGAAEGAGPAADRPAHTREWHVDIYVYESGDSTSATAVLRSDVPTPLQSHGEARRRPRDPDVPEIGDEIAVARALRRLADQLLEIAGLEGHPVRLRS
jgi:hypothetical protein